MLPFLALLIVVGASAVAFAVGRATAEREIKANHHRLAMFGIALRSQDDILVIMSADDRRRLDDLLADYADARTKTISPDE